MARIVIAVFDGEVFRPTERLDLPARGEYRLTIEERQPRGETDDLSVMKYARLAQELDVPADFAAQHDHYLYGTPKR